MHMTSSSLIKSASGFTTVPLDARLLSKRIIYIDDQTITGELIAEVISKIMILVSEDASSMITILLDSEGGGVHPGMVLYDLLRSCRTPIRLVVAGKAYSMAALLFASGRHGRYMLPSSELMIHQPMFEGQVPDGESLKLGVSGFDAALVLVIELGEAGGHLAAARAGRGDHDEAACSLYIVVLTEALVRDDNGEV